MAAGKTRNGRKTARTRLVRRRQLTCVDLFAGCGGLTHGLERAGFRTIAAVEVDANCCKTYRKAFPSVALIAEPIHRVGLSRFRGVDLIAAGPPCQPFSSGGRGRGSKDPRNLIPFFIRAIRLAKPGAFLMENVSGLAGKKHRNYFRKVVKELHGLGYQVVHRVLNASDYGVPQKRRRLLLIGLRSKAVFKFPEPSHGPGRKFRFVPAGRYINKRKPIGSPGRSKVTYAKRPHVRQSPYAGLLFNGGGKPINLRVPCPTILASAGGNRTHFVDSLGSVPRYHARLRRGGFPQKGTLDGARRLSPEESALIQTFPRNMRFYGTRSSKYSQIGNAVPPLLAKIIGIKLASYLV